MRKMSIQVAGDSLFPTKILFTHFAPRTSIRPLILKFTSISHTVLQLKIMDINGLQLSH